MKEQTQNTVDRTTPPIYAIWADARPDGPMSGLSGFLAKESKRLFFSRLADAEQVVRDLEALRLNRTPAMDYHCVEYAGEQDAGADPQVEEIKLHDLRPDLDPTHYEVIQRIYGDTGGGCMVGTLAIRLTDLDKTVWINCNDEGVTVTSADYVWNEDHSGSWARAEDVLMLQANYRKDPSETMGALLPAVQEAVAYTVSQELSHSIYPLDISAQWLPEGFRMDEQSHTVDAVQPADLTPAEGPGIIMG